ncbi:MAG TPA: alpha/beta hydrolase-fold protein [Verrucomicrobiae bacterium]|jgi:enterochelin esterase-like enzyme|nr:alpha/beta hydrolase-fold protein [Verrucomicrobiae bacterium]
MKIIQAFCATVLLCSVAGCANNRLLTDTTGDGDYIIGPDYTNAPELTVRDNVPKGTVHHFVMDSADSKIYPGLNGPYKRDVWVYVPSQYVPGTAAPFIVAQDGKGYTNRMPVVLDNLIYEHRVPAMIAVMIQNGGGDGKGSERGLEYDTVSDQYARFIETEVLPRIERDYQVKFTANPEGRAAIGGSSGAACAFTMAWFRPDLYRRVISYSGTFVDQESPVNPKSPHGAWEYHEHFIPQSPRKPLRLWLQVGEHDNGYQRDEASLHNWVMANERMADGLKAKGYQYHYVFCKNAGHVDRKAVGQTLPEALEWVWRGYPIK